MKLAPGTFSSSNVLSDARALSGAEAKCATKRYPSAVTRTRCCCAGFFFTSLELCVHARLWRNLIDAGLFAAEVQGVIALRLIRLASGGSETSAEIRRMVTEKFTALSAGHATATSAFLGGNNPVQIMNSALLPIKPPVRKNRHQPPAPPPSRLPNAPS